jgi:hypothetical protein
VLDAALAQSHGTTLLDELAALRAFAEDVLKS